MSTDADDNEQLSTKAQDPVVVASASETNPSHSGESSKKPNTTTAFRDAHSVPKSRFVWYGVIAIVGCLVDLWTKSTVFRWLGPPSAVQNIYWVVEDYVGIETSLNYGAVFGLGQGQVWFFATMSFVALAGILYWVFRTDVARDWLLLVTLGIVTGGILGNLYDRLGLWSNFEVFAVRDWIRFSYGQHVWPNFNIADSLLVVGAGLLVWHSFRNPQRS